MAAERPRRKFITVSAAAEMLGCHPRTVRRNILTGKLPAYRLGPDFRVAEADVLALLKPVVVPGAHGGDPA